MKSRHDSEQLNFFDIIKANKVLVDKDTENGDTYDAEATPVLPVRQCVHASTESLSSFSSPPRKKARVQLFADTAKKQHWVSGSQNHC